MRATTPIDANALRNIIAAFEARAVIPSNPPKGCHFHTRCPIRQMPLCGEKAPELKQASDGHWVACNLWG